MTATNKLAYQTSPAPPPLGRPSSTLYRSLQHVFTLDVTHFMVLDQEHVTETPHADADLEFRVLNETDIRALAWEPAYGFEAEMASRIIFGHDVCVAAFVAGRLAAYAWYALDSLEAEHNRGRSPHSGTAVSLPRDAAFLYKGYTVPEYRGRGIYGRIHHFALASLIARGVTRIFATADWTNQAALKSCYRAGFNYLGNVYRFGGGRFVAGVYPPAARDLGVVLGRTARVTPRFEVPPTAWSRVVPVVKRTTVA